MTGEDLDRLLSRFEDASIALHTEQTRSAQDRWEAAGDAIRAEFTRLQADAQIRAKWCAEEAADSRRHRAILRRHMAVHGLEDPTWANLSEREKAVLRAADAEALASPRVAR
ncbi:hypothetical protein ABT369_39335 [Dactylosporangium sp. NPDC000244]|uniref:hypothetical protein n=1 Tax=Dactylosporangium sp. NPDC000244 TaxID=3154365 RepID=UPI00331F8FAB